MEEDTCRCKAGGRHAGVHGRKGRKACDGGGKERVVKAAHPLPLLPCHAMHGSSKQRAAFIYLVKNGGNAHKVKM